MIRTLIYAYMIFTFWSYMGNQVKENSELALKEMNLPKITKSVDETKKAAKEEMKKSNSAMSKKKDIYNWTEEEEEYLARIAYSEAGNQGPDGMALVVRVVINRVESDKFPNTIKEVIEQKNQFSPVSNGTFKSLKPSKMAWKAVAKVKKGWDRSRGALYFVAHKATKSTWHENNLTWLFKYIDHDFYK